MKDPYLQENGTLRNSLGISDDRKLSLAEDAISALRIQDLENGLGPVAKPRGLEDLKRIHRFIFGDLYPWAGTTRAEPFEENGPEGPRSVQTRLNITKGEDTFAPWSAIDGLALRIENGLRSSNGLSTRTAKDSFIAAADVMMAINTMHPFREGNGRTQRAFVTLLAKEAGRPLDFSVVTQERMVRASVDGHHGNPWTMRRLFRDIATPDRVAELKRAQRGLKKLGFSWEERYIAFVEPGHRHVAKFAGAAGKQFMCIVDNEDVLIGWRRDLPDTLPRINEIIDFVGRGKPTTEIARKIDENQR